MIPYIEIPPIDLGIVELQPFGILLAIGVLFGSWLARRYLERYQMDDEVLRWMGIRLLIWGFVISHITNTLFYEPTRLKEDPLLMLKVWQGISSYGGILGGLLGFYFYTRKMPGLIRRRWVDMCVYALVPGYMFGRMGCAVVHDHLGAVTDFPLAVNVPPDVAHSFGLAVGPRHDLGLYEVPVLFTIWIFLLLLGRIKRRPDGLMTAFVCLTYPIPRFFFEFLRRESTDPTYFGLTPAQFFSMAMFAAGLFLLYKIYVVKDVTWVNEPEEIDWDPPGGRPEPRKSPPPRAKAGKKSSSKSKSKKRKKK